VVAVAVVPLPYLQLAELFMQLQVAQVAQVALQIGQALVKMVNQLMHLTLVLIVVAQVPKHQHLMLVPVKLAPLAQMMAAVVEVVVADHLVESEVDYKMLELVSVLAVADIEAIIF
jgi:hypothetical protein